MNTTNLDSNNPTVERQVGRLLPIAELLRDPQATLSEVRRIQEASRGRLAAQQAELTTKQLELLVEQIACALRVEADKLRSRARQQHLAFQHQIAMYLARKISAASFLTIATAFNPDHSCIWACQLIERRVARDAPFRSFVATLERQTTEAASATTEAAA